MFWKNTDKTAVPTKQLIFSKHLIKHFIYRIINYTHTYKLLKCQYKPKEMVDFASLPQVVCILGNRLSGHNQKVEH